VSASDAVVSAIQYANKEGVPFFILGGGSNVLFSDEDIRGLVIQMTGNNIERSGDIITVSAGTSLGAAVSFARENTLTGLEWATGIPGTIGGAVRGNAGAYGSQIEDSVLSIDAYDSIRESRQEYLRRDCLFSYRSSIFKKNKNLIVLAAVFQLRHGNKDEILEKTRDILEQRRKKIPALPSAGSVFKNITDPKDIAAVLSCEPDIRWRYEEQWGRKISAGYLIEHSGLAHEHVGDAAVSEQHANIIVNKGKATAGDVIRLIAMIKKGVYEKYGVLLAEEIELVGVK
jgi:UDP-N-acetylmuramate dehydrogenase